MTAVAHRTELAYVKGESIPLHHASWSDIAAPVLEYLERNPGTAAAVKRAFRGVLAGERVIDCLAWLRDAGRARVGTDYIWRTRGMVVR